MRDFSEEIRRVGGALTLCAAGMILLGILLIVFPDTLLLAFCYIAGGLALAFGLGKLIAYFVRQKNGFVFTFDVGVAAASLTVGLLLLLCPLRVASLFPTIMGVLLIVDGIFKIKLAADEQKANGKAAWLSFAFAALTCLVGLFLFLHPIDGVKIMMVILGVWLVLNGIGNLWSIFSGTRRLGSSDKKETIYVEFHDPDEKK